MIFPRAFFTGEIVRDMSGRLPSFRLRLVSN
jgi:hypothetical protein